MGARVLLRVTVPLLAAALCGAALATDKLGDLQARFDSEGDGIRKAKMLQRLGDAEFDEAARAEKAGDFSTVDLIMEKYRDNVAAASSALDKANRDGERHPGGYKQLEMHVQKALRELDQYLLEAPDVFKPPLQIVKQDLLKLDNKLLRTLFPLHRSDKPADTSSPTVPPEASSPTALSDALSFTAKPPDTGVEL